MTSLTTYTYACQHDTRDIPTHLLSLRMPARHEATRRILCPTCYRADRQAQTAAKITVALPQLLGTERQVAWANDIRAGLLARCTPEQQQVLAPPLQQRTDAKWWIDNRDAVQRLTGA